MAIASKSAETPVGKASGAEVIRAAGEEHRPRLLGGSCTEMTILKALIYSNPGQRVDEFKYAAEAIKEAASSIAHNWMAHGLEGKARALMETYGLTPEDVARSSSLPPEPKRE